MTLRHEVCLLAVVGVAMTACSAGGGDPDETFNLTFVAPHGSRLANGDVDRKFGALVTQDFDLPAGLGVSGQVTDAAGRPLENVRVSFRRTATSPALDDDATDAGGNYSVTIPSGTWVVLLESKDDALGTGTVAGVVVRAASTLDFRFPAPVTVPGVVYESDGITPIAGAELDFTGTTTGATASVTTDGFGEYTLSVVPDTYEVVVTPNELTGTPHLKQRFSVVLPEERTQDFVLTLGLRVWGTVRRRLGAPLGDTAIAVALPAGSAFFPPAAVTSNEDGSYAIDLVPPGMVDFVLEPRGDTGFPRQIIPREVVGPNLQNEDLTLISGFVLRGTILREDGVTPEANVEVRAIPLEGSRPPIDEASDHTDGAGQYAVSLFPGFYDVEIIPKASRGLVPAGRAFPVMKDLVLNVALEAGVTLTGTVTDPRGVTPLPDVRVEIPDVPETYGVTDGLGRYSLLAPVGTHTLDLTAEDGAFRGVMLESIAGVIVSPPGPVTEDITISLATSGARVVQGTVYATDGITPVSGAEVTATDNQTGEVIGVAMTDSNGDYHMVLLE